MSGQKSIPGGLIGSAGVQPSSTVFGDHPKTPHDIIYATPEAMLEAVYKTGNHNYKAHICHFCEKPASQDEHAAYWESHERGCLYLQIEDYLKEIGRL